MWHFCRIQAVLALLAVMLPLVAVAQEPPPIRPRVTIYSAFDPTRLAPVLQAVSADAGVEVAVETGDDDLLLGRLLREGQSTPADILLVSNAARLERAVAAGLLQPLALPALEQAIPPGLRDQGAHWFGIAWFARAVAIAAGKVKPAEVANLEDVGAPAFERRLCVPAQARIGSRMLIASMLVHRPAAAEAWAAGIARNAVPLPQPPVDLPRSDPVEERTLLEGLAQGACDVALVGSRALARIVDRPGDAERALLDRLEVVWPNQGNRGTPIDIVGVGLTAPAEKREPVLKVLAWLVSDTGQRLVADALYAYPVKGGVPLSNPLTRWGPFKADDAPLPRLLGQMPAAGALATQVGWP